MRQQLALRAGQAPMRSKVFSFEPGIFLRNGADVVQVHSMAGPDCILRHQNSYELKVVPLADLMTMYLDRELVLCEPGVQFLTEEKDSSLAEITPFVSDLSDVAFRHGRTKLALIKALRSLGHTSLRPTPILEMDYEKVKTTVRETVSDLRDLKLSTVYKASVQLDQADGDPRSIFPNYSSRGGNGKLRTTAPASEELRRIIDAIREDPTGRICAADVHEDIKNSLTANGTIDVFMHLPSRSTVERALKKEFSPFEIAVRNRGLSTARKLFADHYPRDRAEYALEVIEFDDKDSRTYLVDSISGLPCGRGYITSGIDQATQVPVAISAGDKSRSLVSAMDAFRSCLLPKRLEHLQVEAEFFGQPGIAIFDNALFNHANALEKAILETSFATVAFAKPYTPKEKSKVEDFNGWFGEWIARQPGYGGHKKTKDDLADGMKTATMTTQQFTNGTLIWAYGEYANTARGDGLTARQKWHTLMRDIVPRLPSNLDRFDAAFAISHSLQLRDDGILFTGIPFQCDALRAFRRKIGHNARVEFRYHPSRLDRIFVLDPFTQNYFIVPSAIPRYTDGLTLFQHKLIRKMAKENKSKNPAFKEMMKFREMLREFTSQLITSKKYHDRRFAKRIGRVTPENIALVDPTEIVDEQVSDFGNAVEELEAVSIEPDCEEWDLPEDF